MLSSLGIDPRKPVVGLHAGATWPAKMWPAASFAELSSRLASELGAGIVLTQGPADRDLVGSVASGSSGNQKILPVMGLRDLASVLSCLDAYVANDSGPMHISAAVDTPTVGIFGPGEEDIWFPYVPPRYPLRHVALRKDVPCHPCHLDFCNRAGEV